MYTASGDGGIALEINGKELTSVLKFHRPAAIRKQLPGDSGITGTNLTRWLP
jgi:hypothetical protein